MVQARRATREEEKGENRSRTTRKPRSKLSSMTSRLRSMHMTLVHRFQIAVIILFFLASFSVKRKMCCTQWPYGRPKGACTSL